MTERLFDVDGLRILSLKLSCDEQFQLATTVAGNVGYVLKPEPSYDEPAEPGDAIAKVAEVIARQIECEGVCQAMPSGCGCSLAAANAVLLYLGSLQASKLPNGTREAGA